VALEGERLSVEVAREPEEAVRALQRPLGFAEDVRVWSLRDVNIFLKFMEKFSKKISWLLMKNIMTHHFAQTLLTG
jgi:hypothetical protein